MRALRDAYGRPHTYLRVSVTDRCNLHCRYCRPSRRAIKERRSSLLTFDELTRLVRILVGLGISKVRITGGEPLLRRGVVELVRRFASIPGVREVGLTTNGVLLAPFARPLKEAGLRRVNVSCDSLDPAGYKHITGFDGLEAVLAGIRAAREAGLDPVKINCVVMRGVNDGRLADFIELVRSEPLEVRFLELMPFAAGRWPDDRFVSAAEIEQKLSEKFTLVPVSPREDCEGGVAQRFRVKGCRGTVGLIAPLTRHFCSGCNRLRLLADGALKICLFSPDCVDLRLLLRNGADDGKIASVVQSAVGRKAARHSVAEGVLRESRQSMTEIGG